MIEAIAVSDSLFEFVEWTVDGSLFSSSILDAVTGGDFLFRSPTGVVVLNLGGGSSVFSLTSEARCLDTLLWVLSIFLLMLFFAGENVTLFLMIGESMVDNALSFELVGGGDELDRFLFLLVVVVVVVVVASVSMVMGCDSSDFDLVVVVVVVIAVMESGERPSIFAI